MSKLVHGLLHALSGIASVSAVASAAVPAKYKPVVVAAGALAQGILGLVNHKED